MFTAIPYPIVQSSTERYLLHNCYGIYSDWTFSKFGFPHTPKIDLFIVVINFHI